MKIKVYAVKLDTSISEVVYLVLAISEFQAMAIAKAKYYEKHPHSSLNEEKTDVWKISKDYTDRDNPSVRVPEQ